MFIWLDYPRRDFDPVWTHQYGSGGFFCSNWVYKQDMDLAVPGHNLYVSEIISEYDLQGYRSYEKYLFTTGNPQPVLKCLIGSLCFGCLAQHTSV